MGSATKALLILNHSVVQFRIAIYLESLEVWLPIVVIVYLSAINIFTEITVEISNINVAKITKYHFKIINVIVVIIY